jgi:DNA-binding LacI/PurR family transcriptional regulator
VGANDNVALECMDWLQRRRIAVPQQVSVIGFDNSLPAFHHGLSSYSFNESAVIHAMVEHALSAAKGPSAKGHSRPVEIDGYVVSRRSSAAPHVAGSIERSPDR